MAPWESADRTDPCDRPTVPAPAPGAQPCVGLFCGSGLTQFPVVPGTDRCEHCSRKPTTRMHAVTLEAFCEASRGEAAE